MYKFEEFLLNETIRGLKYYIFDWDDNILKMDTPLHFKNNIDGEWVDVDISPEEFATIRKTYPDNYMDNEEWKGDAKYSFIEFKDYGPRGNTSFLEDTKKAIKDSNFGPSWNIFKKCLLNANLFGIVTTRGHEQETLRKSVEYITGTFSKIEKDQMLNNMNQYNKLFGKEVSDDFDKLLKLYLDNCFFIGLFSKAFKKIFGFSPEGKLLNKGKQIAIDHFLEYVRDYSKQSKLPLKIGFSDDDMRFSDAAKELFMNKEKSLDFQENFYVFDTSKPEIQGGMKQEI